MNEEELYKVIDSLEKLPTLPAIYTKLMQLLQSPDTTVHAISNVISDDQVIAAKVLRFVNSAFYGFPKKISSLQPAIVVLGFNAIRNLVLATSVWDMFKKAHTNHHFDKESFWRHSLGSAVATRVIAEATHIKNPEDAYIGGLLHDIGRLIEAVYFRDKFIEITNEIFQKGIPQIESERRILGYDHSQLGAVLGRKWLFHDDTIQMIYHHHLTEPPENISRFVAAVHAGNIIAMALGLGRGGDRKVPIINNKAWEVLGLHISSLELIMERTVRLYNDNMSIFES